MSCHYSLSWYTDVVKFSNVSELSTGPEESSVFALRYARLCENGYLPFDIVQTMDFIQMRLLLGCPVPIPGVIHT